MNIHDRARQLVAQSKRPMTMSEAYAALAKRRVRKKPEPSMAGAMDLSPVVSRPSGGFWWQRE